jgi:hypothetical protein
LKDFVSDAVVYLESMQEPTLGSVAVSYSGVRTLFQMLWFWATVQMLVTLKQIFSGNLKIVTQHLLYEKVGDPIEKSRRFISFIES